jgi:hypothetical protein
MSIAISVIRPMIRSMVRGLTAGVGSVAAWVLFIPSGSDSFITSDGDTFKVKE